MHLIRAGGLHHKGFGGQADSVFNEKQGRNHGNTLYCMFRLVFLKALPHTDTVHVAEYASKSVFIRYPGADEILVVTGSPQNSAYMYRYIMHVTKS